MEDPNVTLVTALLSAAFGGFIALVSVFITNQGNIVRMNMQFQNDERKRKEDLLRARGEELYELIDKWSLALFMHYLIKEGLLEGKYSYSAAIGFLAKRGERESGVNPARTKMLIDVYYPEIKSAYDNVIAVRNLANELLEAHEEAYKRGVINGTEFLEPFKRMREEVHITCEILKSDVLKQVRIIGEP